MAIKRDELCRERRVNKQAWTSKSLRIVRSSEAIPNHHKGEGDKNDPHSPGQSSNPDFVVEPPTQTIGGKGHGGLPQDIDRDQDGSERDHLRRIGSRVVDEVWKKLR